MTIKRQFTLLATFIIAIPIFCTIYMFVHNYIESSDRLLIKSLKESKETEEYRFSSKEWQDIEDQLKSIPADVEGAFLVDDYILISSIPQLPIQTTVPKNTLWDYIRRTSNQYYYQISTGSEEDKKGLFILRVPLRKKDIKKPHTLLPPFYIILVIAVFICVIILLRIFLNISRSIMELDKKTVKISNGDLTVKIKANEKQANEISSIAESLEKMRIALLEAQQRKNKFIMGMSHDLRTPVSIIKGYTEALHDDVITSEAETKNTLELISSKTLQLEEMIDTLINFTKMDNKQIREHFVEQSFAPIVESFAKEARTTGDVFKRKIFTDIQLNPDTKIPFNKQLITRVFENIFSNALRYTKEWDTISISAKQEEHQISVSIADTGCGIAESDLDKIFDLFYRGTNSRREEGMGVGLSVVKNIIETHNWNIKVESNKPHGTIFTIIIPC